MKFLIIALPRSRTAWLANFLTYGDSFCFHEPLLGLSRVADIQDKVSTVTTPIIGATDTGAMYFVDVLLKLYPGLKLVVIERPANECQESIDSMGLQGDVTLMARQLEWIKQRTKPLVIQFSSLDEKATMEELWNHCIGTPFPEQRWQLLKDMKIEVSPEQFMSKLSNQAEAINEIAKEATLWPGAQ